MAGSRLYLRPFLTKAFMVFVFACLAQSVPAFAASQPLVAGTYYCYTIGTSYQAPPPPDSPSEITRRQTGNNVRPMVAPGIFLGPALFGNIILDGKGGYKMPSIKQTGRYGFDKTKGLPNFTGDLGVMKLVEYDGTGRSFVLQWEGINYHCGLPALPSTSIFAGTQQPNATYISFAGPIRTSAKAADFNGRYSGQYVCTGVETIMDLELKAKADGTITGVFSFGGMRTPEISYSLGSYALKGTWSGTHYVLKADRWIKQPDGYTMIDMEGDLTTLGTSGKILYSSCDSFAARRV